MEHGLPEPVPPQELDLLQQRLASFAHQALAERLLELAFWGYLALFVLAALLLVAWSVWPRGRILTWRGWRDEAELLLAGAQARSAAWSLRRTPLGAAGCLLLLTLCAVSQQVQIDRSRGFLVEQHRRVGKELREASARARAEVLEREAQSAPGGVVRYSPQLAKEVKAAEDQARAAIVQSHYLYLPQGDSMRCLALGNLGLAADYLWLTSLQYVSSPFRQGQKFDLLHRFYEEILKLDPAWVDVHVNAGKILSALDPDRHRTERFYWHAIVACPGDFRLPLEAGKLYVVPPGDPDLLKVYSAKASAFFLQARNRKSMPPLERAVLESLIGQLDREAGFNLVAADRFRAVVRDREAPLNIRECAAREWLLSESLVRVDALQEQVREFQKQAHRLPKGWPELFPGKGEPLDAYGLHIEYDARTGLVSSHGVKAYRARRWVKEILDMEVAKFRADLGRLPGSMAELTGYVNRYYGPPNSPTFPLLEALGKELDCTRNPLGNGWDYHPETGEIRLPPECDPERLYRNSQGVLEERTPPHFRSERP